MLLFSQQLAEGDSKLRVHLTNLPLLFLSVGISFSYGAEDWQPNRTEFGHPDLQGVWYYGSATPMERPMSLGDQLNYSASDSAQLISNLAQAEADKTQSLDPDRAAPAAGEIIAQEADHNFASFRSNLVQIEGGYRTSLIVSPEDGRFPFREGGRDFFEAYLAQGYGAFDGPELRPASERCAGPNGGPMAPMIGWFYNANMQIYQTEDFVIINAEMNHDARIIHLNQQAREHAYPQWMGYSYGNWEGDTLVVNTSQFRPEQSWLAFRMSGEIAVREEFSLIDDDTIFYRYTVTDPVIYSEPFTVEKTISRRAVGEAIYEYACHEGNYSLPSILAGARRQEMDALSQ